ncbi:putative DNA primase/helicase [Bradyrhizobium sp. USDA 3686]|uniref:DUF7146 domain-containing protein n=1 Tax=Bradyrhizobium canariense TaxID=255045 RepID=UPI00289793CA|nr:toprim domain-containing protein [Bradyrhizobium canariense]MBM7483344.1 hypothetical protein [Bradyrhizobium canariense]
MTALNPRAIAKIMGGDAISRNSVNVPGPGHSKQDRSLTITISPRAPGGFVVYSHASDDPMECRDYVRSALGLGSWKEEGKYTAPFVVSVAGSDDDMEKRKAFSQKIWQQAVNPAGTIVERYLRDERGLTLSPEIGGRVVRFHGRLRYGDQTLEGMVCLMRNIVTDEPCGIHRTFLDREGKKVDRRMLGIAKGAAIKVDSQEAVNGPLTVGEGFETVLAARHAGMGPVWALGSAGAIQAFPLIERVTELTLLQERDVTSRRAVRHCTKRYLGGRKPVNVVTPHRGLNDFNDVWLEAQR